MGVTTCHRLFRNPLPTSPAHRMPPFPVPLSQSLLHGGLEIDCLPEEVEAGARAALLWGITEMQPSPDPRLSPACCYLHWEKHFGVQDSCMTPCSRGNRMSGCHLFYGSYLGTIPGSVLRGQSVLVLPRGSFAGLETERGCSMQSKCLPPGLSLRPCFPSHDRVAHSGHRMLGQLWVALAGSGKLLNVMCWSGIAWAQCPFRLLLL